MRRLELVVQGEYAGGHVPVIAFTSRERASMTGTLRYIIRPACSTSAYAL